MARMCIFGYDDMGINPSPSIDTLNIMGGDKNIDMFRRGNSIVFPDKMTNIKILGVCGMCNVYNKTDEKIRGKTLLYKGKHLKQNIHKEKKTSNILESIMGIKKK